MAFMLKGKLGIPDSRYAAELDKRAAEAKFAPDLEAEYDEFFLSERRSQLRWYNGMLFALAVWACLLSLDRGHDGMQRLRLILITLGCAALTWAAFSRVYQDIYLGVARWATIPIAIFGAFEIAHRIAGGQGEALAWLVAYCIGLYFMLGLRYGAAVQSSLVVLASFAVALLVNGQTIPQTAHTAGIVTIIVGTVALAYFQQALRVRKAFLHDGSAPTIDAAIRAHDGEALPSQQRYTRQSKTQQQQLIDFLNSI